MPSQKFCSNCGAKLEADAHFCSACGISSTVSPKSGLVTFLLCLFLGNLGVHRFYVGKIGTGILMLLTGGGLGLWYLYDLISIVCNNFYDRDNRVVIITKDQSTVKKAFMIIGALFAGFIILIATFITLVMIFLSSLVDVGQKELAALRNNNIEEAYSYTSQAFKKEVSLSDFREFVRNHPQLQTNVRASFTERRIENNYGEMKGNLKLQNGSEIPFEMEFVKENSEWKILSIRLRSAY